jgi:indolepyruvate ferredoxin oxidoreductase
MGLSQHRRLERQIISDYEETIDVVVNKLNHDNYSIAIQIASIPELIRGFDVVKEKNLELAREEQKKLLEQYLSNKIYTSEVVYDKHVLIKDKAQAK